MQHIIKYYPVGNGDSSLMIISKDNDDITIITDCKIREVKDEVFDVRKDLNNSLPKKDNKTYTDLFILSHHDEDHCLGFKNNFYSGDISNQSSNCDKIIIDELWVNAHILNDETIIKDSDADYIKKEVIRRRNLYKNNNFSANNKGNRLMLIGSDINGDFNNVPTYIPGDIVDSINNKTLPNFNIYIHAPFKEHLEDCLNLNDRNSASIVFQARFFNSISKELSTRVMFGGDSDHKVWGKIKLTCEKNDVEKLNWDIFQTPHHCSWSFFNDTPYKDIERGIDNSKPKQTSIDILNYKLSGAKIIATSKKIENNDDNPPHYKAKDEYVKIVADNNFYNTEEFYNTYKLPIVFGIDDNGATLLKRAKESISQGTVIPSRAG